MPYTKLAIKPLTKDNYESWAVHMEAVMIKNGTWKYACGKAQKPVGSPREEVEAWEEEDEKARADIVIAMDPSLLRLVKGLKTSVQVWERLKSEFASTGPIKTAGLLKRISTFKMSESEDFRTQLMEFFDITARLDSMDIPIHPKLLSYMLLNSLPPSFNVIKCTMEARDDVPTAEIIRQKVIEEYDSRKQQQQQDGVTEAMWVHQGRGHFNRNQKNNNNSTVEKVSSERRNFRYKCFRCHKVGHKATDCPQKGSREGAKGESSSKAEVLGDAFQVLDKPVEKVLRATEGKIEKRWCLDSGCTSHMCNDETLFLNTPVVVSAKRLAMANGAQASIGAKGTAVMKTTNGKQTKSIQLRDTLLVDDLRTNLLSVAKITDHGYTVLFEKKKATVRAKDGDVRLLAKRIDNLYYVYESMDQVNIASAETRAVSLETWHHRLGHLNVRDVLELSKKGLAEGMSIKSGDEQMSCDVCLLGKMTALPFPKRSQRSTGVLDIVHSDVWGPSRTESFKRKKYFVTFIDDYSRWCEVYFLSKKGDVLQAFKDYKVRVETFTGKRIKFLMTDNGREYCNRVFDKFLRENGVRRRLTVAHTPQQNGVAERKNRTLVEMARCLLIQTGLCHAFWAEAIAASNYLRNRCPTTSLKGHTPFEFWNKRLPNLSHLRVYGAKVYVLQKEPGKGKFDPRSKEGLLVGYSDESKGYRVYIREDQKVVVTRDVHFLEDETLNAMKNAEKNTERLEREEKYEVEVSVKNSYDDKKQIVVDLRQQVPEISEVPPREEEIPRSSSVRGAGRPRLIHSGVRGRPRKMYQTRSVSDINRNADETVNRQQASSEHKTSDEHEVEDDPAEVFTDAEDEPIAEVEMANLINVSLEDAMNSNEAGNWLKAIAEEIKGLIKNDTWKLVDRPKNKNVITCKTILRNKMRADGSLERRKARVVARGFAQRKGMDFNETFAPVARLGSVRLLMALAARKGLPVYQLDVVAAYLNGNLDEEIYMELPEYIEEVLCEIVKEVGESSELGLKAGNMMREIGEGDKVCRLMKALYGLRQAGRQWNKRLDEVLKGLGLLAAENDTCFYYDPTEGEFTILVVYVDDILYVSKSEKRLEEIKSGLSTAFEIKDLGLASSCLGIQIEQKEGEIRLSQKSYVRNVLKKFNMNESNPVNTPAEWKGKTLTRVLKEKDQKETTDRIADVPGSCN